MRLSSIFEFPDNASLLLGLREMIFVYFQLSEMQCFYLSSSLHVEREELRQALQWLKPRAVGGVAVPTHHSCILRGQPCVSVQLASRISMHVMLAMHSSCIANCM